MGLLFCFEPVENDKIIRTRDRVFVFSTIAFIVHIALTVWRFRAAERYKDALETADDDKNLGFIVSLAKAMLSASYGILIGGASIIFLATLMGLGVIGDDKNETMIYIQCLFSLFCFLIAFGILMGLFFTGDLCTEGNSDQCSYLRQTYGWSIVVDFLLFASYGAAWYYGSRLYKTKTFFYQSRDEYDPKKTLRRKKKPRVSRNVVDTIDTFAQPPYYRTDTPQGLPSGFDPENASIAETADSIYGEEVSIRHQASEPEEADEAVNLKVSFNDQLKHQDVAPEF